MCFLGPESKYRGLCSFPNGCMLLLKDDPGANIHKKLKKQSTDITDSNLDSAVLLKQDFLPAQSAMAMALVLRALHLFPSLTL